MSTKGIASSVPHRGRRPLLPTEVVLRAHRDRPVERGPAQGTILVFGADGHVRDLITRALGPAFVVLADADTAYSEARNNEAAAAVVATRLYLPGRRTRVFARDRLRRRMSHHQTLMRDLRRAGIPRLIVLSSAFLYDDDGATELAPGAPVFPAGETMDAWAAEQSALDFAQLGGDVVTLRPGWTYYDRDRLSGEITTAASRGWKLVEGPGGAYVPAISAQSVASAVPHALNAIPGTYNLMGDSRVTQNDITEVLGDATQRSLHSLDYPGWREGSTLFGASRRLGGGDLSEATTWRDESRGLLPHLFELSRRANHTGGNR